MSWHPAAGRAASTGAFPADMAAAATTLTTATTIMATTNKVLLFICIAGALVCLCLCCLLFDCFNYIFIFMKLQQQLRHEPYFHFFQKSLLTAMKITFVYLFKQTSTCHCSC